MKKYLFLVSLIIVINTCFAQGTRWKRTRYEIIGGIGMSNFFGDLGGKTIRKEDPASKRFMANYVGSYRLKSTRPSLMIGMRYKVTPALAVRVNLIYGFLQGNDATSNDDGKINRNLNFWTHIFEQDLLGEYSIIKESNSKRWSARRRKKVRSYSINLYVFGGVGGLYFDPRSRLVDESDGSKSKSYRLRSLGTEGQTVEGSEKKKYSPYALCFPGGIGIKYGLNRLWDVGFEYGYRLTLTDYIDDVGGAYFDNAKIVEANGGIDTEKGKAAGRFADNHKVKDKAGNWVLRDTPYPDGTTHRSGVSNDNYMFLMVTLSYKLRTARNGLPKFKF